MFQLNKNLITLARETEDLASLRKEVSVPFSKSKQIQDSHFNIRQIRENSDNQQNDLRRNYQVNTNHALNYYALLSKQIGFEADQYYKKKQMYDIMLEEQEIEIANLEKELSGLPCA